VAGPRRPRRHGRRRDRHGQERAGTGRHPAGHHQEEPVNRPTTTAGLHEQLWQAVVAADEYAAVDLVVQAMDDGVSGEDLLLDVIARVQERIGSEWAADRLTVAQEHAATAINERVVTALSHHRAMRQGKPS